MPGDGRKSHFVISPVVIRRRSILKTATAADLKMPPCRGRTPAPRVVLDSILTSLSTRASAQLILMSRWPQERLEQQVCQYVGYQSMQYVQEWGSSILAGQNQSVTYEPRPSPRVCEIHPRSSQLYASLSNRSKVARTRSSFLVDVRIRTSSLNKSVSQAGGGTSKASSPRRLFCN